MTRTRSPQFGPTSVKRVCGPSPEEAGSPVGQGQEAGAAKLQEGRRDPGGQRASVAVS